MTQTGTREDTVWLTDREQLAWRSYVAGTSRLMRALESELSAGTGLSLPEYEVFVRLSAEPDRKLRMSELAEKTMYSRSRLSHMISRLEREGWITRSTCADDRRGTWANLTDAGMAKLEAAAPIHVESVRRHLIDVLSCDQLQELGKLSALINDELVCPATEPADED